LSPERPGRWPFGVGRKGVHSRLGDPGICAWAWLSVKESVIRRRQYGAAGGWITAREHVAPRGVRDSRKGKALEGDPRNGYGTKQGRGVWVG
jgi:hypothetical protein